MATTDTKGGLPIDELARRAGVTTRNVRAHQERGLLAPPRKVGRTGYYDEHHLERLLTIGRLQDQGFSLAAIGSLLEAWDHGESLAEVLGFEQALAASYTDEPEVEVPLEALVAALPDESEGAALGRAVEAGVVTLLDDGQVLLTNPTILRLAEVLFDIGIPVDALADEAVALRRDADAIAGRFVELFLRHVWADFEAAGAPIDDLPRITEAIERTRPVPSLAASTMVAQAMRRRMDDVSERMLRAARAGDPLLGMAIDEDASTTPAADG